MGKNFIDNRRGGLVSFDKIGVGELFTHSENSLTVFKKCQRSTDGGYFAVQLNTGIVLPSDDDSIRQYLFTAVKSFRLILDS